MNPKTINIAVFNDAANTILPGLEVELVQQAKAFAAWCNASGGINGRHVVIDDRDAALFNAAQQATAACQSDFMAVGGGMALDQPSVPIREKCGLGQISGYVVSDASDLASDQVDPSGVNTNSVASGWFGALAKAYPQAVKQAGMGGSDIPPSSSPKRSSSSAPRLRAGMSSTSLNPRSRWRTGRPTSRTTRAKGSRPCGPPTTPTSPPSPRR